MGRKSTIDDRVIFAAVGQAMAREGQFTLQNLSDETGVSIGSLYHRYASREGLLAAAWHDALTRFQTGFLEKLRDADLHSGKLAALETPRFCRAERSAAIILACCRQAEFLKGGIPNDLATEIAQANDEVKGEVIAFSERVGQSLMKCRLALVAYPVAAVKLFLPDETIPEEIDAEIVRAYEAAMF